LQIDIDVQNQCNSPFKVSKNASILSTFQSIKPGQSICSNHSYKGISFHRIGQAEKNTFMCIELMPNISRTMDDILFSFFQTQSSLF